MDYIKFATGAFGLIAYIFKLIEACGIELSPWVGTLKQMIDWIVLLSNISHVRDINKYIFGNG